MSGKEHEESGHRAELPPKRDRRYTPDQQQQTWQPVRHRQPKFWVHRVLPRSVPAGYVYPEIKAEYGPVSNFEGSYMVRMCQRRRGYTPSDREWRQVTGEQCAVGRANYWVFKCPDVDVFDSEVGEGKWWFEFNLMKHGQEQAGKACSNQIHVYPPCKLL